MVSRLRTKLKTVFALSDDPLHPYSHDWLPRFRAFAEVPTFSREDGGDGDTSGWWD
jgi:hypothetical protein